MDFKMFGGSEVVGKGVLTKSKFSMLVAAVEFRFPRMKGRLCRVRAALKGWDYAHQPRHTAKRPQSASFLEENEGHLAEGLRLLRRTTPAGARLFPVSLPSYRNLIKAVQAQYSLDVGWGPYSPRAGFASESAALGVPFEAIRETGRWRVDSSLRIYIDVVQASQVGTALRAAGLQPALDWATRRWFDQVRTGLDAASTGHAQTSSWGFVPSLPGTPATPAPGTPMTSRVDTPPPLGPFEIPPAPPWTSPAPPPRVKAPPGARAAASPNQKKGLIMGMMKRLPTGSAFFRVLLAILFFSAFPACLFPNTSRSLIVLTDVAEEVGTAGGRIIAAAASVSTSAAKFVTAVTDGSIGVVEAAWRGVDLLDVEAHGSSGRLFVEVEDSWEEFLAEPEVQHVLRLEPDTTSELERLLLLSSARRPIGEFTHAVFRSPQLYSLVSFWVRWFPCGHVGIAWGVVSVYFRPQWANPSWALLGINETAEAPSMAERLQSLAVDSFPAPDLEPGPDALVGAPTLPNGLPRRLLRRAARGLLWLRRSLQTAFQWAGKVFPAQGRSAGAGDGNRYANISALTNFGPLAEAGGGERA
ncbi:unnamed protein product [Prorocentrum cordatum]|uniref:Uncharacterized protein n=1 Tax=Prorocentrum cordatum TaxID=2364126 RepID=A0ABN9QT57_9DINO|nr:unnamed protein product [Polarella glacialis]